MTALQTVSPLTVSPLTVQLLSGANLAARMPSLEDYITREPRVPLSRHPKWLLVLQEGMGHSPFAIEANRGDKTVGLVCLSHVRSLLFGRYLVSMPYLNTGGILADDGVAETALAKRAVSLADELRVRYLELRHEQPLQQPTLSHRRTDKVHMRLELPTTGAALWEQITAKVRNQIRKGQKHGFTVHWGREELLDDFFAVFSHNMRDLGTPTFGRRLFAAIIKHFPGDAEFCVLRDAERPIASALLLHGKGVTEVPSASSLKSYNSTCANMLLYWQLLERTAERRQRAFDFGRSSEGSSTFKFKKQWGAKAFPAEWQYYLRDGTMSDMRKDNPKYQRMIAIWRRLPVGLTRRIGPLISRGIP
jgi:FemAB-related protein (PEP-CTERM system-associated)